MFDIQKNINKYSSKESKRDWICTYWNLSFHSVSSLRMLPFQVFFPGARSGLSHLWISLALVTFCSCLVIIYPSLILCMSQKLVHSRCLSFLKFSEWMNIAKYLVTVQCPESSDKWSKLQVSSSDAYFSWCWVIKAAEAGKVEAVLSSAWGDWVEVIFLQTERKFDIIECLSIILLHQD